MSENPNLVLATPFSKVVLAVLLAEKAVEGAPMSAKARRAAEEGLGLAWAWLELRSVRAEVVHEHGRLLAESTEIREENESERSIAALCAEATALYYMAARAYQEEVSNGVIHSGDIPNDMFDVDDGAIEYVRDYLHEAVENGDQATAGVFAIFAALEISHPSSTTERLSRIVVPRSIR